MGGRTAGRAAPATVVAARTSVGVGRVRRVRCGEAGQALADEALVEALAAPRVVVVLRMLEVMCVA